MRIRKRPNLSLASLPLSPPLPPPVPDPSQGQDGGKDNNGATGSSFFALLKKRVLLVHVSAVVADRLLRPRSHLLDLFCEPFPEACGLFLLISLPSIAQATIAPSSTASWPVEYRSASAMSDTPAATALSCSFCPADLDRLKEVSDFMTNNLHLQEEIKITGVKIFVNPYSELDEEEVKAEEEAKLANRSGSVGVGSRIGKYLNARTFMIADSAGKEGAESDKSSYQEEKSRCLECRVQ
ncbi:peptidyl-prolyl cis-trans isomerase CYP65 [Canna indica]|uniref:Peptidyl-prolyl cis-trans isomerase CYP65 n=1 Tax=Canna indica TaxID=4628 RepID=A0AAQ3JQE6_9LILI|nr:peptidyl-prolyl cis-trans isomerase CYP65 [Canna indica]